MRGPRRTLTRGREDDRPRAVWRIVGPTLAVLVVGAGVVPMALTEVLEPPLLWSVPIGHAAAALVAVLVLVGSARLLDRRPVSAYGFEHSRRWWSQFGGGVALGAAVVGVSYLLAAAFGSVRITDTLAAGDAGSVGVGIAIFTVGWLCVAFWEEAVFRGMFVTNGTEGLLARSLSPTVAVAGAVVVSSVVFGLVHAPGASLPGNTSLAGMLLVWTVLGGLLGVAYVATGQLAVPIGMHLSINLVVNNVVASPVPGQPATPTLLRADVTGPPIWHPVGGLPMLAAAAVGLAVLAGWWYWHRGSQPIGRSVPRGRMDS